MIEKGFQLRKVSFCLYYTYEVDSFIEIEVLLSFEEADIVFNQNRRKVSYLFSESDCIKTILKKVDEGMGK